MNPQWEYPPSCKKGLKLISHLLSTTPYSQGLGCIPPHFLFFYCVVLFIVIYKVWPSGKRVLAESYRATALRLSLGDSLWCNLFWSLLSGASGRDPLDAGNTTPPPGCGNQERLQTPSHVPGLREKPKSPQLRTTNRDS